MQQRARPVQLVNFKLMWAETTAMNVQRGTTTMMPADWDTVFAALLVNIKIKLDKRIVSHAMQEPSVVSTIHQRRSAKTVLQVNTNQLQVRALLWHFFHKRLFLARLFELQTSG